MSTSGSAASDQQTARTTKNSAPTKIRRPTPIRVASRENSSMNGISNIAETAHPMPTSRVSPPSSTIRSENSAMDPAALIHMTMDPAKNSARPGSFSSRSAATGPTLPTRWAPVGRPRSSAAAMPAATRDAA